MCMCIKAKVGQATFRMAMGVPAVLARVMLLARV